VNASFGGRDTTAPGAPLMPAYAARRLDAFAALREAIIEAILRDGEFPTRPPTVCVRS